MEYQIVAVIGWGMSIALAGTLFYMSINRRIQDWQRLIREEMDAMRRWVESDQDWMRRKLHEMEREMKDPLDIHNKGKKFYNTEA